MRTRIVALLIVFVLIAGAAVAPGSTSAAKDAPGCEGLAVYRAAIFAAGHDLNAKLVAQGIPPIRDRATYSSSDWTSYAQDAGDYQTALKTIAPPAFAAAWHQAKIEHTGLLQQISLTVAKSNVLAISAFAKSLTDNAAKTDAAVVSGAKTCADFTQFTID